MNTDAALDVRTKNFAHNNQKRDFATALKARLGADYDDVILESLGEPNEHLHVEYDPKPYDSKPR